MHYEDWFVSRNPLWFTKRSQTMYCRNTISQIFFKDLISVTNYAMLCLFTYLSVKFSEPLENYQEKFLLLF